MTALAWIDKALTAARPQAIAALMRYFRNLDTAEEAFQEACLRALKTWPEKGPPRDPAAWLIFVGRNAALDAVRRQGRDQELPEEAQISDLEDAEANMAERLDNQHYRDDILRLLFVCCDPVLPVNQQIALALRVVSGLTVTEIARAFLVGESAMEQRITRAKRRIGEANVPFDPPGATERAERLATVATMIYLVFNEGYSASGGTAHIRVALCEEAIRLARLLSTLFPGEPEIMGLTALLLLQHARTPARLHADGTIVLLEDQDRGLWNRKMIAEGIALVDKAMRHRQPGSYQIQAAIAALHDQAAQPAETDWAQIEQLYASLERLQPSPVVTLNRAVAVSKVRGAQAALEIIEPLAKALSGYFYFHGVKGALLMQLGRAEEAKVAFDQAIARANSAAEAAHIRLQIDRLIQDCAAAKAALAATQKVDARMSNCGAANRHQDIQAIGALTGVKDMAKSQAKANAKASAPAEKTAAQKAEVLSGIVAYLAVKNATEAAKFYQKAFGATEAFSFPPDETGRTLHIHLHLNGASLMLSDPYPEHGFPHVEPQGYTLHLPVKDIDASWKRAVDAGATVVLPVQKMFWGDRYGQLRDPFGVTWSMGAPA